MSGALDNLESGTSLFYVILLNLRLEFLLVLLVALFFF